MCVLVYLSLCKWYQIRVLAKLMSSVWNLPSTWELVSLTTEQGTSGTNVLKLDKYRSIIIKEILFSKLKQVWRNHMISQRNQTKNKGTLCQLREMVLFTTEKKEKIVQSEWQMLTKGVKGVNFGEDFDDFRILEKVSLRLCVLSSVSYPASIETRELDFHKTTSTAVCSWTFSEVCAEYRADALMKTVIIK